MGSEHELQQPYRLSRAVLREAVRLVEHHQVARIRRSRGGRLLIAEPATNITPSTFVLLYRFPVPLLANTTQTTPLAPLTTAPLHQPFSSTPDMQRATAHASRHRAHSPTRRAWNPTLTTAGVLTVTPTPGELGDSALVAADSLAPMR